MYSPNRFEGIEKVAICSPDPVGKNLLAVYVDWMKFSYIGWYAPFVEVIVPSVLKEAVVTGEPLLPDM